MCRLKAEGFVLVLGVADRSSVFKPSEGFPPPQIPKQYHIIIPEIEAQAVPQRRKALLRGILGSYKNVNHAADVV